VRYESNGLCTRPTPVRMGDGRMDAPQDRPARKREMKDRGDSAQGAYGLTEREVEVLRLVAAGMKSKEIAALLRLRAVTVNRHVGTVLVKMGARTRTEAAVRALREGWLDPPGQAVDGAQASRP
jgi:DNA-binding NarL/FixJ family response regulator